MKKMILVLLVMLFLGVAMAAQIDPKHDVLTMNDDGELIEIFGINAWISDTVIFSIPVSIQNGTAIIGGR